MRISDWSSDVCSSDLLSEGQMRMLADTPPLVMGLFPGTDFFTLMSVGVADDGSHGTVMVASTRSEERRVGEEGVSTCRSRWAPDNEKKQANLSLATSIQLIAYSY